MACTSAVAAGLNIGVVDIAKILDEAPQAEAARSGLEREFGPRERELVAAQKKIKELEDKLSRDGAVMSESERGNLERDIMQRKREAKRDQDAFRDDLNFKRNEALEKLQQQMVTAIRGFANEKKYDLILAEGVVYMSDTLDVTSQVLEHLKRQDKASGSNQ
jgi:outer membrane protein